MNETKILNQTLKQGLEDIRKAFEEANTDKGIVPVVNMLLQYLKGDKGEKPVKGVDYLTEEEIKEFTEMVAQTLQKSNGKRWAKEDREMLVKSVLNAVKIPKAGKDFYTLEDQKIMKEQIRKSLEKSFTPIIKRLEKEVGKHGVTITHKASGDQTFIKGIGVTSITVGKTPPAKPKEGDLWIDTR